MTKNEESPANTFVPAHLAKSLQGGAVRLTAEELPGVLAGVQQPS